MSKSKSELITPARAQELLDNGVKNRRIKRGKVKEYIQAMEKNEWADTGEPIILDDKGKLLDGRHRLTACVESGKSFRTDVRRGVPTKNFVFIDSGASRSAGDVLSADGFVQDRTIAAAVKVIDAIKRLEKGTSNGPSKIRWGRKIAHKEILNFARRNKGRLVEAAEVVRSTKAARSICSPNGVFVALFFMFANRGGITRARTFFNNLITGENLDKGDPILKIREYLFNIKGEKGHSYQEICAIVIKGWNSWTHGQPLRVLVYDKDGEGWPRIEKP